MILRAYRLQLDQTLWQYLMQRRVIEKRQTQQHGLKIEPVVITGDQNTTLQQKDTEGCEKT